MSNPRVISVPVRSTVNPLYSKVPRARQKLDYKEIFTIESAQYSVKSEPGDFEQLYYMEIFTIGRFTIERVNCILHEKPVFLQLGRA